MRFASRTLRCARQFALAVGLAVLASTSSLAVQSQPAFEFFAVSGSSKDVPALIVGTSEMEDSLNIEICNELAKGHAPSVVAAQLHLSPADLQSHVDALLKAELLRAGPTGSYVPSFPIIHRADAEWFQNIDQPLIDATVRALEARQKELREHFREVLHLDAEQAQALSLVLFGDAMFDRWQTKNVRKDFLPGYPPARDGKLFYLAGLEKSPGTVASLGIYSHTEQRYGDITVVTFGNTKVLDPFADRKPESAPPLLASYVAFVHGGSQATADLQSIGLVAAGKPVVAIITQSEYARLPEITNSFTDELLSLLNRDRPKIMAAYQASPYSPAVSFQEFALWWYHFLDAAVVNRLIKDGVIVVPPAGYATMIVVPDATTPHS